MSVNSTSTPQRFHEVRGHQQPFDICWWCGRDKANCKRKVRYLDRESVDVVVAEINMQPNKGYVKRYPCRWCVGYHVARARRPVDVRRAVRATRKAQLKLKRERNQMRDEQVEEPSADQITVEFRFTLEQMQTLNSEVERRIGAGEWPPDTRIRLNDVILELFPDVEFVYKRVVPGMHPGRYPEVPPSQVPAWDDTALKAFLDARRRHLDGKDS